MKEENEAREMLAAEYRKEESSGLYVTHAAAIRAITKALSRPSPTEEDVEGDENLPTADDVRGIIPLEEDVERVAFDKVVNFLMGQSALDGLWFGERPSDGRKPYWWRTHLRAAIAAMREG